VVICSFYIKVPANLHARNSHERQLPPAQCIMKYPIVISNPPHISCVSWNSRPYVKFGAQASAFKNKKGSPQHETYLHAALQSKLSCQISLFARPLAVTAHDLDLVRLHSLARILHLEGDILDQKGPDLVAETVSIEMALCSESHISPISNITPLSPIFIYLKRQPRLHFLS
jgi:hypothetical protein